MADQLAGEIAVVTGAGRGFGKAIALEFARRGAAVTVTSRTRDELDAVVAEIARAGGRARAVTGDVTRPADVERVIRETEREHGAVSLLVSNAGVPGPFGPLWTIDPQAWWTSQEVHIRAPMLYLRRVMPGMIERRRGRIILVSALASRIVAPYLSAYCVGKIAQTRITAEAAAEAKELGVSVFAIDPGFVFTGIAEETMNSPDAQRWLPGMVARLRARRDSPDRDSDLARCARRCLDLASGRYDALSGRYMELDDDIEAMRLEAAAAAAGAERPPSTP
ncbi:MAG TPA: SDR family oxidoreductase [Steroidobacteraceae bacterium]|nr:SDR family oxidoreductase [Steroidobacteraceae bacterium]